MATTSTTPDRNGRIKPNFVSVIAHANRVNPILAEVVGGAAALPPAVEFDPAAHLLAGMNVGYVVKVPVDRCHASEFNARVYYHDAEVDAMAESLISPGQSVPAIGYASGQKVVIVDGQKRLTACIKCGVATLLVYLIEPPSSSADEYELSRSINLERSSQTALDDACRMQTLVASGVYPDQVTMAQRMGWTEGTVSKILGINRIPEQHRRTMLEHPHTTSLAVAYEISCMWDGKRDVDDATLEQLATKVIGAIVAKNLGRDASHSLIASQLTPKKPKAKGAALEQVPLKLGAGVGTLKLNPLRGEFSLVFKGLSAAELTDARGKLSALFG